MPKLEAKPCDLVVVIAYGEPHVVEVPRGSVKNGDYVEFEGKTKVKLGGYVEDIHSCNILDDLYCFIGSVSPIHFPTALFNRSDAVPPIPR